MTTIWGVRDTIYTVREVASKREFVELGRVATKRQVAALAARHTILRYVLSRTAGSVMKNPQKMLIKIQKMNKSL